MEYLKKEVRREFGTIRSGKINGGAWQAQFMADVRYMGNVITSMVETDDKRAADNLLKRTVEYIQNYPSQVTYNGKPVRFEGQRLVVETAKHPGQRPSGLIMP